MGGRGTFASGNNVKYNYKQVGEIEGIKVLNGDGKKYKGLPVESHSSRAYIQLHPDGKFKMYREYDKDHYLRIEIGYHIEPNLTGNRKYVLHIHEYKDNIFKNRTTRLLTKKEIKKYRKYFVGIDNI